MLPTHKTILPKKFAPKHTMSQGNAPHPPKGKLIYPHTINILHLSFHPSLHFLSSIQHAHTSLKSSKSNTYKTKRPLYSTWLYKGLFLRYLLYFLLSIALSFCPWEDEGRCLGIVHYSNSSQRKYHQIKNADFMRHSTASISSNVTLFISFSKTLVAN